MKDIAEERMRLIYLLEEYLAGAVDAQQLSEYAWSIIDYFTEQPEIHLPQYSDAERDFWYAIWLVQHLADEEHIRLASTRNDFEEALQMLKGSKPIPAHYIGRRPTSISEGC